MTQHHLRKEKSVKDRKSERETTTMTTLRAAMDDTSESKRIGLNVPRSITMIFDGNRINKILLLSLSLSLSTHVADLTK